MFSFERCGGAWRDKSYQPARYAAPTRPLFVNNVAAQDHNMPGWEMKQRNFIKWQVSRKRNQRGWTQDVFADKLQLAGWYDATRSTVSKIEDGSLRIDLLQLYFIAVALGVSPKDFLAELDWHKQAENLLLLSMKHSQPMETYGDDPKN